MKIIFTFGGLPHYYNNVLNRLNSVPGIEVKVIIPKKKGKSLGKGVHESPADVEFKVIPLEEKNAWYGKLSFKGFHKTITEERPDIVVTIWPYVLGFILNPVWFWAKIKFGFRLVYKDIPFNIPRYDEALNYYRDKLDLENLKGKPAKWGLMQIVYYGILRLLIKGYLRYMDAHVYYSEDAFEIIPSYGVPKENIFIIYNSPDTDRLFEVREKIERLKNTPISDKKVILHIGRLVAWKKVDILIEAFKIVLKNVPDGELWIVGSGPEMENLKSLVNKLGIDNYVKFKGAIYDPFELGKITMNSTVYVLAGMGGLAINEAMAYGKPVICTRADGTEKKLVRDGFNGSYFIEGDPIDLANKIETLLNDPAKVKLFGKNSSDIIKNEINIHAVIKGYMQAFKYVTKM